MLKQIALSLVALSVACSSVDANNQEQTVESANEFHVASDNADITNAMDEWNQHGYVGTLTTEKCTNANGCSVIEIVDELTNPWNNVPANALAQCYALRETKSGLIYDTCEAAYKNNDAVWYKIQVKNIKQDVRRVVLHELGHAFGKCHTAPGTSLMSPEANQHVHLEDVDLTDTCAK